MYYFKVKVVLLNLVSSTLLFSRGPNKYTRNWEDEEAYTKPPAQPRPKRVGGARNKPHPEGGTEEFPPLSESSLFTFYRLLTFVLSRFH